MPVLKWGRFMVGSGLADKIKGLKWEQHDLHMLLCHQGNVTVMLCPELALLRDYVSIAL